MRGSVRKTSLGATAEDMDPVFINVEGGRRDRSATLFFSFEQDSDRA